MKREEKTSKNNHHLHHKHEGVLKLLNIAKGHISGIEKMILEDKYCIDISKQILAVISILKKVNLEVLKKHIETCVRESRETEKFEEKLEELKGVIDYLTKGVD
ncbi:MAG: metal-sensing transcriptional repressor [Caldisericia bacterium]|jgi:DNA-binding FrmR family transcriptional regulator|nr:metal-sensing transcriptional repressor [Caldisericia bacterium]